MRLPKLTPLQTRLAVCIGTSLLLIVVYFTLSPAHFAYAAELDSILHDDHNHERIDFLVSSDVDWGELEEEAQAHEGYEPEFGVGGLGRELIGRAPQDITPLKNNVPINLNLEPNRTVYYVFENASIWGPQANTSHQGLIPDPDDFGDLFETITNLSKRKLELRSMEENGLEKRQNPGQSRTIYISANTCLQPNLNGTLTSVPPQLSMFVSTSNQNPGPGQPTDQQQEFVFDEGFVNATIQAGSNVYMSIHAPSVVASDPWNFIVAASIDDYYFSSNSTVPAAFLVDSDQNSALIVSSNLTSPDVLIDQPELRTQWEQSTPPFSMFIVNGSSNAINGVRRSTCGLSNIRIGNAKINSTITTRNSGNNPKQQFYIDGLSPGSSYYAILSYDATNKTQENQAPSAGGGGHIWQPFSFSTKQGMFQLSLDNHVRITRLTQCLIDANCKLIYDLPFCNDVAYAVPSNATATRDDLVSFYDNSAQGFWQNFTYSLQQIACNTTSTAQYSLVRNCTDCARDYKTWLCSVTIPRCVDFTHPVGAAAVIQSPFIIERNLAATKYINGTDVDLGAVGLNSSAAHTPWLATSRFPAIDTTVKPGPYRELLPCIDICYEMVKSCPSSMGFGCPRQRPLVLRSYGYLNDDDAAGVPLPCNRLGVDQPRTSSGLKLTAGWMWCLGVLWTALLVVQW
jgi:calcium channel MID1